MPDNDELYLLGSEEEMTVSTMMIVEGTENKRPGVLCEVEGPFIVLNEDNNNDRWYTKSLIDNRILGVPYTKKMLDNKTLYGEASHPSDRFDVKLPLISHNITGLWYNDTNTILMGHADVLDTPSGRIIYTLVKYGSKIGISVRARGRLINKNGKKIPDEAVYQFKTFDFVPNPGFDEARMSRVDESEADTDIATSFMNYVNEASVSELSCIQSIFESADNELFGDIKKVIKERMSENTLTPTGNSNDEVIKQLYEETVKYEEQVLELEDQVEDFMGQISKEQEENKALQEEVSTLKLEIEQKDKDIEDMSKRLITLSENESINQQEKVKLSNRVSLLVNKLREYRDEVADTNRRLEESEQMIEVLEGEKVESLQKLNEAQEMVVMLENKGTSEQKKEVPKAKKRLPQGKSQVLNESVVDIPITTNSALEGNTQRRSFILNCTK